MKGFEKLRTFAVLLLFVLLWVECCQGFESLYSDHKASRIGDIITVIITERTLATNRARIATEKESKFSASGNEGTGALDFVPGFSFDATLGREHGGQGVTERSGTIIGRMAAVVTEVLENGNLVIRGEKEIMINNEKETLILTGVVRPEDILMNNAVYSTNVANTSISYKGKGLVNSGSKPGIIARLIGLFF
ncbi:MAG: flagellar basal body L-ring protein FlgH [bacterium]